jgi:ABC-type Mn2+/Zn2+ transport system ATPase subunit
MSLIQVDSAAFGYRRRTVVRGVSCRVDAHSCLAVYGPNGAGKTTLLRGISGLIPPLSGMVSVVEGIRFGYLPQHRAGENHWPMTAFDAAALAISAGKRWGRLSAEDRAAVSNQLAAIDVSALADRPFFELSGGQQQRVMLAGALAARPAVLLLDEPTGGLDRRSRDLLLDRLRAAKSDGLALVVVTHDLAELLALADTALLLEPASDDSMSAAADSLSPRELADRCTGILADPQQTGPANGGRHG